MTLKLKAVSPKVGTDIPFPSRATAGSAGLDLRACLDEPLTIAPRQLARIPTGVAIALPGPEYAALVFARSGLGVKHGISLSNGVGVIDSDYRGEIQMGHTPQPHAPYSTQPGDRIAQLVVTPVVLPAVEIVKELEDTGRGTGGFGSTGR